MNALDEWLDRHRTFYAVLPSPRPCIAVVPLLVARRTPRPTGSHLRTRLRPQESEEGALRTVRTRWTLRPTVP